MDSALLAILVCPVCKGALEHYSQELWCKLDKLAYPIRQGIPVMLPDEARALVHEDLVDG